MLLFPENERAPCVLPLPHCGPCEAESACWQWVCSECLPGLVLAGIFLTLRVQGPLLLQGSP